MKKGLFSDKEFYSKLLRLMTPIALQGFMLAAVAVADALMLGNVEQNMMSAVSMATQVQFIQNMVVTSVTGTAAILGAQYWGKKDKETVNDIFHIALKLAGGASLLFFAACLLFPRYLMLIFTNEESLVTIGMSYLRIASVSYLLTGLSQCYLSIMKVSEHVSQSAIISSSVVVINIILNGILIFGLFGLPTMNVEGAAYATVIARGIEFIWVVSLSYRKTYIHPKFSRFFVRQPLLFQDYRKCMMPLLGASLLWGVGFTSYTSFMGHLGEDAAAANSVTAVVRDMVCCLCDGIAAAAGIIVGNELGAGNLSRGRLYSDRLTKISYVVGVFSTAVMLLLIPVVLQFIQLSDGAVALLKNMMIVMAVYMIGRSVNTVVINGIFAAGGDTLFDMYSLVVTMWCIAIPLAALGTYVFHWHPVVIYAFTCLDEVGKIPWVMGHYKKYRFIKDLTRNIEHTA